MSNPQPENSDNKKMMPPPPPRQQPQQPPYPFTLPKDKKVQDPGNHCVSNTAPHGHGNSNIHQSQNHNNNHNNRYQPNNRYHPNNRYYPNNRYHPNNRYQPNNRYHPNNPKNCNGQNNNNHHNHERPHGHFNHQGMRPNAPPFYPRYNNNSSRDRSHDHDHNNHYNNNERKRYFPSQMDNRNHYYGGQYGKRRCQGQSQYDENRNQYPQNNTHRVNNSNTAKVTVPPTGNSVSSSSGSSSVHSHTSRREETIMNPSRNVRTVPSSENSVQSQNTREPKKQNDMNPTTNIMNPHTRNGAVVRSLPSSRSSLQSQNTREDKKETAMNPPTHITCERNTKVKLENSSRIVNGGVNTDNKVIDLTLDDGDSEEDGVESSEEKTTTQETHIIFTVDFSGSMRTKDVKDKNNGFMTRWDAVFECIGSVLQEQVNADNKNDKTASAMVSVVIFNLTAQTLLERMPIVGDGQKVMKALKTAQKMHTPHKGTSFSAGLERARSLANCQTAHASDHVMLILLSDGRPGDLNPIPPQGNKPMQKIIRFDKKEYPAAGTHIEAIQQEYGDRFNFQLICLCSEGQPWLRYLANRYHGTIHTPDLTMDDDEQQLASVVLQNGDSFSSTDDDSHSSAKNDSDYSDDESDNEIEEILVKSSETMIREKYNRALAEGRVQSLVTTIATSARNSSMRSTFQTISSAVTAMRQGGSALLQERRVKIVCNSPMIQYAATRMVLDDQFDKVMVVPGEKANDRLVKVSMHPFAQGGLRNVYLMKQDGVRPQVAKESRHDIKYQERLRFHFETAKCQAKALDYSFKFNQALNKQKKELSTVHRIRVLRAEVYRLNDPSYPGGFRYLAVEDKIDDDKYEKYNSNNGYVNPSDSMQCQVAQAFSHFTYETSGKHEMVVDIQGSYFTYTDPQLHSVRKEYGRADRGDSGFKDFFKTHKCNFICQKLGLTNRSTKATSAENSSELVVVKQEKN